MGKDSKKRRRTALGFTGYTLRSNKDVFPHDLFRMKGYCNTGVWLYNAAGDSVVRKMKIEHFQQRRGFFVPFYTISHALHRSCLPSFRPICHRSIKSLIQKEGKVVCSENYKEGSLVLIRA
jgi:phosphatidylserine decarboxylase